MTWKFLISSTSFLLLAACSGNDRLSEKDDLLKQRITLLLEEKEISNFQKDDSLRNLVDAIQNDSLRNLGVDDISYHYLKSNDSILFKKWNDLLTKLAIESNDSVLLATSYWDLGNFYFNFKRDSAFFLHNKAYRLYISSNDPINAGRTLLNMAMSQKNMGDYTGSEISTINALKLLKNSGRNQTISTAHNNLSIIYDELKEFEKSLEHQLIARKYLRKLDNPGTTLASSFNNSGVTYQKMGNNLMAMTNFKEALRVDSLYEKDPKIYAMILDNNTYSRMLMNDTIGILESYQKALRIRDSIGHIDGVVINKIHLSEYYGLHNDTTKAVEQAREADGLAQQISNNRDILASSLLLAQYDTQNSREHFTRYIALSDSLQQEQRKIRNKFTKIEYDTDEFIAENEKLYSQRNVLLGISLGIALLGFSGFVIKNQRSKNRELVIKQEQQEANEKIYNLLLDQQKIKEEERQKERKRISQDLHDGVLAKFFGIRMSLDSLNTRTDPPSILLRQRYLNDLKEVSSELRNLTHELHSSLINQEVDYLTLIKNLSEQYTSLSIQVKTDQIFDLENLSGSEKIHLYRIIQEALKNTALHSNARTVELKFIEKNGLLELIIKDNGQGFIYNKAAKGIGLENMKSRTKAMGGKFNLESQSGKGTTVIVRIPVKKSFTV